jgi:thymidine kinase
MATRFMDVPDNHFSGEDWISLCRDCNVKIQCNDCERTIRQKDLKSGDAINEIESNASDYGDYDEYISLCKKCYAKECDIQF